jgi:predicted Zn finger-like uncharacterized protein
MELAKIRAIHRKSESFTMILTCPQCATRYLIDDGEMRPEGRKVKCGACGEEWRVTADGEPASASPSVVSPHEGGAAPPTVTPALGVTGPETSPVEPTGALAPAPPVLESLFVAPINTDSKPAAAKSSGLLSNLLLGVVILAVLAAAAFAFRAEIVRIAPKAAPVYSALGISMKAEGPPLARAPAPVAAPPHE